MSLQELKILLYMVSKIKPNDAPTMLYSISIRDFCRVCNIDCTQGWHYVHIKKSLDEIDRIRIWLEVLQPNGKIKKIRLQWFHRLVINDGSGIIEYSFNDDMKDYLFHLEIKYTLYYLENILPMTSKYAIRVYQLLKSYENMNKTYLAGIPFPLSEFKKHVDAENYERFPDLRRRVIEPALEEINRYTDIRVIYHADKVQSKSVNQIRFSIFRPIGEEMDERREARLTAIGFHEDQK